MESEKALVGEVGVELPADLVIDRREGGEAGVWKSIIYVMANPYAPLRRASDFTKRPHPLTQQVVEPNEELK